YTPLPALSACPSCGSSVQADASFCGQCGFDLRTVTAREAASVPPAPAQVGFDPLPVPSLTPPDPLVVPEPIPFSDPGVVAPTGMPDPNLPGSRGLPVTVPPPAVESPLPPVPPSSPAVTRLQVSQARLLHVQTNALLELPPTLPLIRIGKPNDRVPPDIDVSGFPESEIVSRVHANIRSEGDAYYIEDVGSSNGTYVNNMPLPIGNRHRLRAGDRISLGKGDKVSFIFQIG
ncbi:MAG TPA: FHA domain-containing protein, partial [Trichocoleus sp.]